MKKRGNLVIVMKRKRKKEKGNGVSLLLTENDDAHHLLKIIEVSQEDNTSSKPNKRSPNGTRKDIRKNGYCIYG